MQQVDIVFVYLGHENPQGKWVVVYFRDDFYTVNISPPRICHVNVTKYYSNQMKYFLVSAVISTLLTGGQSGVN